MASKETQRLIDQRQMGKTRASELHSPNIEAVFLDEQFREVGSSTKFSSLIINQCYDKIGDVQITGDASFFKIFVRARYAAFIDHNTQRPIKATMVIQSIENDMQTGAAVAKGKTLEYLLQTRIIRPYGTVFSGHTSEAMADLINRFAGFPEAIPKMQSVQTDAPLGRFISVAHEQQATVADRLFEVGNPDGIGFHFWYDYMQDAVKTDIYQGKDRTGDQQQNTLAIFTEGDGQVISSQYQYSDDDHYNFAQILGEGEGNSRTEVLVDLRTSANTLASVLPINAKNIKREAMTLAQYQAVLRQKGVEKLYEYGKQENVNVSVVPNAALIFGQDYALGDIVEYRAPQIGLTTKQRITSVKYFVENGRLLIEPLMGIEKLTVAQTIERMVK